LRQQHADRVVERAADDDPAHEVAPMTQVKSQQTAMPPQEGALHTWALWYPKAGATGLLLARGRLEPTDAVFVHAAPDVVTVEVYDDDGNLECIGQDLQRSGDSPMCLLRLEGGTVTRAEIWPAGEHLGLPVLLPGGEIGRLRSWWHSDDKKEWRWGVDFYNSIREEGKSTWSR
jgi:hypothetical protein